MGVSGAAITYLVERMITSGHLLRDSDPADRRKVMLRVADDGMEVARDFFTPLAGHTRDALANLPDGDLAAAHRVFGALIEAMGAFRAQLDDPNVQHGATHRAPGSGRVDGR
jgi:DNA-binding MarR family transcriptional regulator